MDINKFKKLLEEEKARLESELKGVGQRNPKDKNDWQATPEPPDPAAMDPNERADRLENFEERVAVEGTLEDRLGSVRTALKQIEDGTYGTCNVGGTPHPIEEKRLEANPAAATCIAHINGK